MNELEPHKRFAGSGDPTNEHEPAGADCVVGDLRDGLKGRIRVGAGSLDEGERAMLRNGASRLLNSGERGVGVFLEQVGRGGVGRDGGSA